MNLYFLYNSSNCLMTASADELPCSFMKASTSSYRRGIWGGIWQAVRIVGCVGKNGEHRHSGEGIGKRVWEGDEMLGREGNVEREWRE